LRAANAPASTVARSLTGLLISDLLLKKTATKARELAHDGELFAATGGVVINPHIRKEALARIGR
jgi:hypothetical protein